MYFENGKTRRALLSAAALLLILFLAVSCEDAGTDLMIRFPPSLADGSSVLYMTGEKHFEKTITSTEEIFRLMNGTWRWQVRKNGWATGPLAEGTIVLAGGTRELIVTEPELSQVSIIVESDTTFNTKLWTVTGGRTLGGTRNVHIMSGMRNEIVLKDVPPGMLSVTMLDESGEPLPPMAFTVEQMQENIFRMTYRGMDVPIRRETVTLRVTSPKSMDTEVLWRHGSDGPFTSIPVRVLANTTTVLKVGRVPVGNMEAAVRTEDGSLSPVRIFSVIDGSSNSFLLDAGIKDGEDSLCKATVRLKSEENRGAVLCWKAEGMTAPVRRPVALSIWEDKIILIDGMEEGLLSVWLDMGDGKIEERTEVYVSPGHMNTVSLIHRAPLPPEPDTTPEPDNKPEPQPEPDNDREEELPQLPDEVKPRPTPNPVPPPPKKWGKLNLHVKCNSTERCILYFLYPGDREWRTHDTKFNGIAVGRDYEFNNIPPGKFRYTFGLPGREPFPVTQITIDEGMNNAYKIYYFESEDKPLPPLPDFPGSDEAKPAPPPVPKPDETIPQVPEKTELKGRIHMKDVEGQNWTILSYINESQTPRITCTWYVDGKKWTTGQTVKIRDGAGMRAEVWVTSPEAKGQLVLSTLLPHGQFVPFRTIRKNSI